MLVATVLTATSFLGCADLPKVTLNQLDTKHGVVNPFRIVRYDENKCVAVLEDEDPFPISNGKLHGGYCLSWDDYKLVRNYLITQCKNAKDERERKK